MNNCCIREMVKKLSWTLPESIQEEAIDGLVDLCIVKDVNLYDIFRETDKSTWINYCIVVEEVGSPKNVTAIPALLILLKDTNWPGSMEALSLLLKFRKEDLVPSVEKAIRAAFDEKDFIWLAGIKILVEKFGLTEDEFAESSICNLLDFADY